MKDSVMSIKLKAILRRPIKLLWVCIFIISVFTIVACSSSTQEEPGNSTDAAIITEQPEDKKASTPQITESKEPTQTPAPTQSPTNTVKPTIKATPTAIPTPTPIQIPAASIGKYPWNLILVNYENSIDDSYGVSTVGVGNGHKVDARIADSLNKMLNDCRAQGLDPIICSSYRTYAKQKELFDRRVKNNQKKGMSYAEAVSEARTVVAYPGTSEHQTGLAVDIVSRSYQKLNNNQEKTAEYQWIKQHCAEYGFILRYPSGKTSITGIIYEPWHFRYVGMEAAQAITSQGICLEEYLKGYEENVYTP